MNQKRKDTKLWYAVLTYIFASIFISPLIFYIVITIPAMLYIFPNAGHLEILIITNITVFLGIIFGIYYSSKYINKKYFIRNKTNFLNLSTLLVVLILIGNLYFDYQNNGQLYINTLTYIVFILLFYIMTNRFIKSH